MIKNLNTIIGNGKFNCIVTRNFHVCKSNDTISFACIVVCWDESHFVVYFVVDKERFYLLNIKPIVTETTMNRSIIFIDYGCNFCIANFSAFSGLPAAFVVLCVLTKEVRTMARITTKKHIASRQMKKRRLYSRGQTRRCSLRLCYRRRSEKQ